MTDLTFRDRIALAVLPTLIARMSDEDFEMNDDGRGWVHPCDIAFDIAEDAVFARNKDAQLRAEYAEDCLNAIKAVHPMEREAAGEEVEEDARCLLREALVKLEDIQGYEAPSDYACFLIGRIEKYLSPEDYAAKQQELKREFEKCCAQDENFVEVEEDRARWRSFVEDVVDRQDATFAQIRANLDKAAEDLKLPPDGEWIAAQIEANKDWLSDIILSDPDRPSARNPLGGLTVTLVNVNGTYFDRPLRGGVYTREKVLAAITLAKPEEG